MDRVGTYERAETRRTSGRKVIKSLILYALIIGGGLLWFSYHKNQNESSKGELSRGITLYNKGNVDSARGLFQLAVDEDSDNAQAWLNLGNALAWSFRRRNDQEDMYQAISAYQRAFLRDPTCAEARYHFAECLMDYRGDYVEVKRFWFYEWVSYRSGQDERWRLVLAKREFLEALKYVQDDKISAWISEKLDEISRKNK